VINLIQSLEGAADGAFAIDDKYKIVYWNRAAEEILGYEKKEMIGHPCYLILQGVDERQRLICLAHCPIAKAAFDDKPVANYDIQARNKTGGRRWLNMSILAYREGKEKGNTYIFHLFRDITKKKDEEALLQKVLDVARHHNNSSPLSKPNENSNPRLNALTPRESDVLTYLANGYGTDDIAQALFIAPNTVRNHIQNILQKLHIHSRTEAVSYAIRYGLVD
jgi:PAS domain S-box-containing protein